MKNFFTITIAVVILFISCDQQKSKDNFYLESENVFDEAIEIHDEVMPLMGNIMKLQSSLKEKKENTSDEEKIQKINESLQSLEDAHSSMMDWMRNLTQIPDQSEVDQEAPDFISAKEMLRFRNSLLKMLKKLEPPF